MILRLSDRLVKGSHADVFAPEGECIYKLFRIGRTDRLSRESRAAFVSQIQAYEIAGRTGVWANTFPRTSDPVK